MGLAGLTGLAALRDGLIGAARAPWLALILYLTNLVPAGLVALALGLAAADRPWLLGVFGGDWLNVLVELAAAAIADGRPAEALGAALLVPLVLGVGLLVQGLLYALVAGGILERLRGSGDGAVSFRRGCARWFWPFVRLGLLGMTLFVPLALFGVLALAALGDVLGAGGALVGAVAWLGVLGGWLELARAGMVARGDSRAAHALGRAARLALHRRCLIHLLPAWLILTALGLAPPTAQLAVSDGSIAGSGLGEVLAQLTLLSGAWIKVARLATALALDRRLASLGPLR